MLDKQKSELAQVIRETEAVEEAKGLLSFLKDEVPRAVKRAKSAGDEEKLRVLRLILLQRQLRIFLLDQSGA